MTKFEKLQNYYALEEYAEQAYKPKKTNYLFIDEVQLCDSFESYLKEGGMAGSFLYKTESEKFRYVNEDVFNTLVIRDIVKKYKIRNKVFLEKLIDFLMDNVGNITSIRNVAKTISATGDKTNHKTIGSYIDYLCKAFAFYKIRRFDIRGKRYLTTEDKYYLSDHSFRYARLGTRNMDYGHVYENMVAMELLRRGYQLYVGVLYKKEIDFVAMKHDEKLYIQVSETTIIPVRPLWLSGVHRLQRLLLPRSSPCQNKRTPRWRKVQ